MLRLSSVNYYLICIILILAFNKGLLAILGLNETISQLLIEFLIIIMFINSILIKSIDKIFILPAILINSTLVTFIIISFLLTDVNQVQMILFLRNFFIYYLFFYALFNSELNIINKEKIKLLIIYLFLLQLLATFIKLLLIGTTENYIGTISVGEGSIAAIMPLFAITYLLSIYLISKKIKYLILVLFFILTGLASNKIAIIFYIIILYIYLIYIYSNSKKIFLNFKFIKKLITAIVFLTIILSLFVSLNPRTNPEGKVGGSIDINYLIAYSKNYQTLDTRRTMGIEGDGRFDAPLVAMNRLTNASVTNIFVGFGPGELVKSSFTKYNKPLLEKYKIGYGGRIGLVWVLMQLGIIGLIIFLSFHISLFIKAMNIYKKYNNQNESIKIYGLTFLGLSLIYFLDFFTYSPSLILNPALVLVYFYTFYYLYTFKLEGNIHE